MPVWYFLAGSRPILQARVWWISEVRRLVFLAAIGFEFEIRE